jgi:hypothetical protein
MQRVFAHVTCVCVHVCDLTRTSPHRVNGWASMAVRRWMLSRSRPLIARLREKKERQQLRYDGREGRESMDERGERENGRENERERGCEGGCEGGESERD